MFWTDLTKSGNPWNDRGLRLRLVDTSVHGDTAVIITGPGVKLRGPAGAAFDVTDTYRAFRLDDGDVDYFMCEAPTLAECQALAVTLYKMEEP